jgi:outer membrane protein TolC
MADQVSVRLSVVLSLLCLGTSSVFAQQQSPPSVPAGPLTLEQVLELAQSRSEAIGIAQSNVQRAEGAQVQARSGRLPQLTASASYDRALASEFSGLFGGSSSGPSCAAFSLDPAAALTERVAEIERAIDCGAIGNSLFGGSDDVELPFGRKNTWRVNLAFSQSIYSGGRLAAQADISLAARESADLAVTSARAQLLFDATQAFYDAVLSDRLVQIAEATVAQADATVQQVQSAFEAGAQPEFELLRARVTRDNQRPAVIRRRADRDIALLRLKQLLDLPPDFDLRLVAALDGPVPPPPAFADRVGANDKGVVTDGSTRTVVREAGAAVRLREASLRSAQAERRPAVSVVSNYSNVAYPSGALPTGDFRTNWTVGATVNVPVLTGGRQRGSEMVSRAELESARLQLQQVRELASLDARSAEAELTAARAALDASSGTIEQARRAFEIAGVRFQSGVSTQLELSDARLLLQQAEANRAQAARDLQVARARVALLPELPLGAGATSTAARAATVQTGSAPSVQQQPSASPAPQTTRPGGGNQ